MTDVLNFSALKRHQYLSEMSSSTLDVLIIGGGITGAGIALDAASRGLRVGLVEKKDFASGTSSKSTKLIHGGLRYLKQGEMKLVREVGRERAILFRNAPHIVIAEKMLLPLVEGGTYGKFATSIGLWLYDYLAGVARDERRVMLSREETLAREPLLKSDVIKGAGLYYEYRTDDTRLTVEVLKTARKFGARMVNYAKVDSFFYEDGKLIGARVCDEINRTDYNIVAQTIVNATGPWVDGLREQDKSLFGKRLHLTKGVHIVVPYARFPLQQSVYFDVPGGRMIFAIPRDGCTYIGTTDTNYEREIDEPTVTQEDVDYLLNAVNHMFPKTQLTVGDIQSSWAGLRPLIHEDGKSPSELSRKDEIFISPTGLISIAGGKLTGYRKMAERVVDEVVRNLSASGQGPYPSCCTDSISLSGGEFRSQLDIPMYVHELLAEVADLGITDEHLNEFVHRYGSNTREILDLAKQLWDDASYQNRSVRERLAAAEAKYAIHQEMATSPADFFIRRTGRVFFQRTRVPRLAPSVAESFRTEFAWRAHELERLMDELDHEIASVVQFS